MLSFDKSRSNANVHPIRKDCTDINSKKINVGDFMVEFNINPESRAMFLTHNPFGRYGKVIGFTRLIRNRAGEIVNSETAVVGSGETSPTFVKDCYVVCDLISEDKSVIRQVIYSKHIMVFSPEESSKYLSRWAPLLSHAALTVGDAVEGFEPGQIPEVLKLHLYSEELLDMERRKLHGNRGRVPDIGSYITAISEKAQELSKTVLPVNMGIFDSEYKKLVESALEKTARRGGRRTFRKRSKKSRRRYKA